MLMVHGRTLMKIGVVPPQLPGLRKNKLKSDGHADYELSKCPVAKKLTARLKNNIQFN